MMRKGKSLLSRGTSWVAPGTERTVAAHTETASTEEERPGHDSERTLQAQPWPTIVKSMDLRSITRISSTQGSRTCLDRARSRRCTARQWRLAERSVSHQVHTNPRERKGEGTSSRCRSSTCRACSSRTRQVSHRARGGIEAQDISTTVTSTLSLVTQLRSCSWLSTP